MKIHEYQAKEIFRQYGIRTPRGEVAKTPDEAREIAARFGGTVVVKAQIHAGGRGKGGGVKLARSPEEAFNFAQGMLGHKLITHQTGPEGKEVLTLLIEEGIDIAQELYLGIVLDRAKAMPAIMASAAGGMDIEQVAHDNPEKIHIEPVQPLLGLQPFQLRKIAYFLGLPAPLLAPAQKMISALLRIFMEKDCSLIEINPLIITKQQEIIALDGKINFDDNALFRHEELLPLRDITEEDPAEVEAAKYNLSYIKLDGTYGCMVNGAGLAMATMDLIKLAGGNPANFLDVGGSANSERVAQAFKIIMADPKVKAVLINIFGGIVRCDRVAHGIIEALQTTRVNVPIVVRLDGTNAEEAKTLLRNSPLNFIVADSLADAAQKIMQAAPPEN
jgi:succinyl-CoA synthetase beta subunit